MKKNEALNVLIKGIARRLQKVLSESSKLSDGDVVGLQTELMPYISDKIHEAAEVGAKC